MSIDKIKLMLGNEIELAMKNYLDRAIEEELDIQMAYIAGVEEITRKLVRSVALLEAQKMSTSREISEMAHEAVSWLEDYFTEDFWSDVRDDMPEVLNDKPTYKS